MKFVGNWNWGIGIGIEGRLTYINMISMKLKSFIHSLLQIKQNMYTFMYLCEMYL